MKENKIVRKSGCRMSIRDKSNKLMLDVLQDSKRVRIISK